MSEENLFDAEEDNKTQCPICLREFTPEEIEEHANKCLFLNSRQENPVRKKRKSSSPVIGSFSRMAHSSPKLGFDHKSPRDIPSTNSLNENESTAPLFQRKAKIVGKKEEKIDTSFKVPLAIQVRPTSLDNFFGQNHVLGKDSILRSLLEKGEIQNMILWGPPGCGKTSLSRVVQEMCNNNPKKLKFVSLCAASCGIKDVSNIIEVAKNDLKYGKRTVLFMDEIHRFNKKQQDVFLLSIEKGHIILMGATTENPSFALNSALLSRCRVIVLEKLQSDELYAILENAAEKMDIDVIDESNLAGTFKDDTAEVGIEEKALKWLADVSDGDARIALGNLQLALQSAANRKGKIINVKDVENEIKKSHMLYDKAGEEHYNIISAMHKSIRGSDPNAALYWTTRMIVSGEDPRFIARRLVRAASEDIGVESPESEPIKLKNLKQIVNRAEAGEPAFYCGIKECATCENNLEDLDNTYLQWQSIYFCDTICLRTFHKQKLTSCCTSCYKELPDGSIGKFVFRFYKLAQFCSSECFDKYRRDRKSCVYCRSKILNLPFNYALNPKFYCSRACEIKHTRILNPSLPVGSKVICFVCKRVDTTVKIQIQVDQVLKNICSQNCFQTFVNQNELVLVQCESCKLYLDKNKFGVENKGSTQLTFCSKECKNFHIFINLKITECKMCGIRRFDTDLIRRCSQNESDVFFCSIDCYVKNYPIFASVNNVSSRIANGGICSSISGDPVDRIQSYLKRFSGIQDKENISPYTVNNSIPSDKISNISCNREMIKDSAKTSTLDPNPNIVECYIIEENQTTEQNNVSTSCKPKTIENGTTCMPIGEEKEVQTEKREETSILVPFLIPVNIPTPVAAFSSVVPKPVPFPVAIPVPLFVPLTRKGFKNLQYKQKQAMQILPEESDVLNLAAMVTDSANIEDKEQRADPVEEAEAVDSFFEDFTMMAEDTDYAELTEEITENGTSKMEAAIGILAWNQWLQNTNIFEKLELRRTSILNFIPEDLGKILLAFVTEIKKPNGADYAPDTVLYLCLSIQTYLNENGRPDNIFYDHNFEDFVEQLNNRIKDFPSMFMDSTYIVTRVTEDHLWESKQLGDHSPYVLLNTILYHNMKYFGFTTLNSNLELFMPKIVQDRDTFKYFSGDKIIQLPINVDNQKRCASRLFKLYLSKLPRTNMFRHCYLKPEIACNFESPIWYTNNMISKDELELMVNRLKVVAEVACML